MQKKDLETFCPTGRNDWRDWLKENHDSKQSVWLICYKKETNKPTISWSDAVDEAICFGWIDSTRRSIDHQSFCNSLLNENQQASGQKSTKKTTVLNLAIGLANRFGAKE